MEMEVKWSGWWSGVKVYDVGLALVHLDGVVMMWERGDVGALCSDVCEGDLLVIVSK
jgi:hypothetical protein